VFDVGGTIQLQSTLYINNSNLTIAGQTAPGAGIAVIGNSTVIQGSNEVVRYMRFRAGDQASTGQDSLSVANATNVVVDHVSASWGMDESLSVTLSNNVTVQNSIVAETLNPNGHSDGSLVRGNVTDATPGGYTLRTTCGSATTSEIRASARGRPMGTTTPTPSWNSTS